ncbi:MAG: MMPL family transporter [Pseudomonadota bacterium]
MADGQANSSATFLDRVTAALMKAAADAPKLTLLVLGALLIAAAFSITRLGVDADSTKMLSPDLPDQKRAHALNEAFPDLKSTILVAVTGAQPDAADLAVGSIVDALKERPELERVFAPAVDPYLAAHGFLYRDVADVAESFTRLSKSANLLATLRSDRTLDGFAAAMDEATRLAEGAEIGPEALDRLFAEAAATFEAHNADRPYVFGWSTVLDEDKSGQTTRLISILPKLDTTRLSPAKPALRSIEEAIATLPEDISGPVDIGITGEPALRAEEMQSVLATIGISLAASLVLVALILRFGLGAWGLAVTALTSLVISLVLTTGFAAIAVGTLNLVSVAFIVLMVGLGIDFAIHILAHIQEMRRHGSSAHQSVTLTGQRTGLALALSAVTTSLAFLAFAFTDFDGMAQLGLIGGAGVVISFLVAATAIPAILVLRPGLIEETAAPTHVPRLPEWAPFVVIAIGLAAIWPASLARFSADPMELRDPGAMSVSTFLKLAADPQITPYRASVLVENAAKAGQAASAARDLSRVGRALTFGDLVPDDQDRKLDLLDLAYASIDHAVAGQPTAILSDAEAPPDRLAALSDRLSKVEGMSQRLHRAIENYRENRSDTEDKKIEESLFQALPLMFQRLSWMLNADFVSRETLPPALAERYLTDDGTYRVEILPAQDLSDPFIAQAFAEDVIEAVPEAAGGPVQLAAAARTVAAAMLQATLLAAVMTGLLALLATRRLIDALAILLPLSIAGFITAAASALLGLPFNYANVIVLPLMIGIGVDSGIHIAMRERRAPGAVFATSTPRAVVVSAATTVAAFGTLAFSDHRGTASMGMLLAISMMATVICVLTLTPSLIRWASGSKTAA